MGMFDSVYARCPECGASVEFQSKAGECGLKRYHVSRVPADIAIDLDGQSKVCACGFVLKITPSAPIGRVAMIVNNGTEDWD